MSDFGKLKQRLGRRRGFDGNIDRLGGFINDAYLTLCSRRPTWSWLRRTRQFNTVGKYTIKATLVAPAVNGAVFTNGSVTVTNNGVAISSTNTGAKLACPDSTVRRIRGGEQNGLTYYLESPYTGTTTGAAPFDSFSIYFDEYPLPPEATSIEALTATGNGWTVPVQQQSLLSPHMKVMPVDNNESYPRFYTVERHHTIPAPIAAPVGVAAAAAAPTLAPDTTYYYAYAYFNSRTLEVGPLSTPVAVSTTATERSVNLTFVARSDYRIVVYRSYGIPNETYTASVNSGTDVTPELYHLTNLAMNATTQADTASDSSLGYSATDEIGWWAGRGFQTSGQQHIRLWPPPDDEYLVEISYFIAPKEMTLDSDVPVTPRLYQNVILDLAEALCLSEEENHSAASQKRSYALEQIQRMERDDNVDPGTPIELGRGTLDPYEAVQGNGRWPRNVTG